MISVLHAEQMRIRFGHYRDTTLGEIAAADVLYLDWLSKQDLKGDRYLGAAVQVLVEKHAATIAEKQARGERPKLLAHLSGDGTRPAGKQLKLF